MPSRNYLLFHQLPYDYTKELPFELGNDVTLEKTPFDILTAEPEESDHDDYRAHVNFILPGYDIKGNGVNHCCLSILYDRNITKQYPSGTLFFTTLTAMRLFRPAYIYVAGGFRFESRKDHINDMIQYNLKSIYNPDSKIRFSPDDLTKIKHINGLLISDHINSYKPLVAAITLFSQITNGLVKSYQMAYLGLFTVLESLFRPEARHDGDSYDQILSNSVPSFLSSFVDIPDNLSDWLCKSYRQKRNKLAHGMYEVNPDNIELSDDKINEFGKLHETTRLCILGFLSLNEDTIEEIRKARRRVLRNIIDNLKPDNRLFLTNQKLWLV